jgi:hypothetical protein
LQLPYLQHGGPLMSFGTCRSGGLLAAMPRLVQAPFALGKGLGLALFLFFAMHALFDYPLQGDFTGKGKSNVDPIQGVPWYQLMFAHSILQAFGVYLVCGELWIAMMEFALHFAIDYAKCNGWLGDGEKAFNVDQSLHYVCKLTWAVIICL